MFWTILLILHGLAAVFLIGAITHQSVSAIWAPRKRGFVSGFASVRSNFFTDAIVVTYIVTFVLGSWIYTDYRYNVKPLLEDLSLHGQVGFFELKEHALAIGLLILPAYWMFWRKVPRNEQNTTRTALTLFIAFCAWLGFLVGHVLNNTRGL